MSIYEYFNDQLGVNANVLISGERSNKNTIGIIGKRGLEYKIHQGNITRLRTGTLTSSSLIKWDTIPADWQNLIIESFGDPQYNIQKSLFEKYFIRDPKAIKFYSNYQLTNGKFLPDTVVDEYILNASVLNTIDFLYSDRHKLSKELNIRPDSIWSIIVIESNRFRDIQFHTLPANAVSLRRNLNKYIKEGYQALIHGNFCNKSARKVDDRLVELLNSMFAYQSDKPTPSKIARQYESFLSGYVEVVKHGKVDTETGEVLEQVETYNPNEFPKISKATIMNYLSKWSSKVGTHTIRSGNRQVWMSKFRPYHDLNQPKYSGSIISIDDRVPPFEYAKGKRLWFYNGIDLGSEAFTTWVYGQTKEGIILDFYRQMVRNYTGWGFNLPAELEGERSLNSSFLNTFLKEGAMFERIHIEANNARGKRIEAYYRPLRYNLEKEREGWLARPFALSEANQAGPIVQKYVPYNELAEGCLRDIETWNNMEHSKIKGKTRWEVFIENQNPEIKPTNWRAFLPYLGYKTETSCNVGQISFNNKRYLIGEDGKIAYSSRLIFLMEQIEGKEVDVYWLDGNDCEIMKALVYMHGTDLFICEAVKKPSHNKAQIERTPEDIVNYTAMAKYVSSVDAYINRKKKEINKVTVIDNTPKTLNNKFQISGLRKATVERIDPVEIMENVNEDDLFNDVKTSFNKSLKDRF